MRRNKFNLWWQVYFPDDMAGLFWFFSFPYDIPYDIPDDIVGAPTVYTHIINYFPFLLLYKLCFFLGERKINKNHIFLI